MDISCNAPLCGRLFIPSLAYDGSIRLFVSVDAVQRNVIGHLHPFLSLQAILHQPIYSECQRNSGECLDGLPRKYCLPYESWPLPTSYFSALQKRLLEDFVDKNYGSWRGGFVNSKLGLGICNNDTSLSGVRVSFLVEL